MPDAPVDPMTCRTFGEAADARSWQTLGAAFQALGIELLDWLQTDAERVRSLSISCDACPTWKRRDPDWTEP